MLNNRNNNSGQTTPNNQFILPTTEDIAVAFGKKMKSERIKQGLTQAQLAKRCELSLDTIKRYEQGKAGSGRMDIAIYIAIGLNISIDKLFINNIEIKENSLNAETQIALDNLINLLKN